MADILKNIIALRNNAAQLQKSELLQNLKKCKERMEELQVSIDNDAREQQEIMGLCRKIVHENQEQSIRTEDDSKREEEVRFDWEVVQFLACRHKVKEAKQLVESLPHGHQFRILVQLYERAFEISDAILRNDLRPLKEWCE